MTFCTAAQVDSSEHGSQHEHVGFGSGDYEAARFALPLLLKQPGSANAEYRVLSRTAAGGHNAASGDFNLSKCGSRNFRVVWRHRV
jgi:hypothetical protein